MLGFLQLAMFSALSVAFVSCGGSSNTSCKVDADCAKGERCNSHGFCIFRPDEIEDGAKSESDFEISIEETDSTEPEDEYELETESDGDDFGDEIQEDGDEFPSEDSVEIEESGDGDISDPEYEAEEEILDADETISCDALDACPVDQVCNLSVGRCETRSSLIDSVSEVTAFNPNFGSKGDVLAIDGKRFFYSLTGNFSVKVWIGASQLTFLDYIAWDENRLLVRVPAAVSGIIGVQCEGGALVQSGETYGSISTGVVACDGSTPPASGFSATSPVKNGQFAAGHLDYTNDGIRVFYPAQCGSIRRQAVPGNYPLIVILHGNGAAHINYEYLGQLLASRGFVVMNPPSDHTNSYDEEVISKLYNNIMALNGKTLSSIHTALTGISTTGKLGFICHSRGCGRFQELIGDHSNLSSGVKASVFLGPANLDVVVPGLFMVFGATKDGQSLPANYNGQYNRQSAPKWKIVVQGGNHSLFADAKLYYSMDGVPTITRQRQLSIVASFVIPLMERAFGITEANAEWLDNAPINSDYTVDALR